MINIREQIDRRIASGQAPGEDAVTELFAKALREDLKLARAIVTVLAGGIRISGRSIPRARVGVETQVTKFPSCRLDLCLTIDEVFTIALEHKVGAREGPDQLWKYCGLPVDRVGLIAQRRVAVDRRVRKHPKYLHPVGLGHFRWWDFYRSISQRARNPKAPFVVASLDRAFRCLGFTPPVTTDGELVARGDRRDHARATNFGKLWLRTEAGLATLGWERPSRGSRAELYTGACSRNRRVAWAWATPFRSDQTLLLRINPRSGRVLSDIMSRLARARLPFGGKPAVRQIRGRVSGPTAVIELRVSLARLCPPRRSVIDHAANLASFVVGTLAAAG